MLGALQSKGTDAEVARAYDIHPVTLSSWKKQLKENGSKAFGGSGELKEKKDKIAKLERMVGQKETEIDLLKNFWAKADHERKSPPPRSAQGRTRVQLSRNSGHRAAFTPRRVNEIPQIASDRVNGTRPRNLPARGSRWWSGADRGCTIPR